MKNISRWLVFSVAVLAMTGMVYAQAQAPAGGAPPAQQRPPAQAAPAQAAPSQGAAQETKTFEGSLVSVDAAKHTLTAKDAANKETQFMYTDQTPVTGAEKSVQGLAGKSGAKLKITYRVEQGANHATRIEMAAPEQK